MRSVLAVLSGAVLVFGISAVTGEEQSAPSCHIITHHTVVAGETLSHIVRNLELEGKSLADPTESDYREWTTQVLLANQLNSVNGIHAGQELAIPALGSSC